MGNNEMNVPFGFQDDSTVVYLQSMEATYCQEADDHYLREGAQSIEIQAIDAGAGVYFVIKTSRWSFDDIDDLTKLLENFKKRLLQDGKDES